MVVVAQWKGCGVYLCLWDGGVSLVSCDGTIQQTGVEVEEGVHQVEGGGREEQPTVVLDEVQAGLYQPVKEISDQLLLLLQQPAKVVTPPYLHCIRYRSHVGVHQRPPAKLMCVCVCAQK